VPDLSERRRRRAPPDDRARQAELEIAALVAVPVALAGWSDFEPGAARLLAGLAQAMEVEAGALWVPERDVLATRAGWHAQSLDGLDFAWVTDGLRVPRGVGLVGRAWEDREPVTSARFPDGCLSRRDRAAARAGLRGALAFPALHGEEVLAVFEFHSREEIDLTPRFATSLSAIGDESGEFLSRHRGQLDARKLTVREVQILQLAAGGGTTAQLAERLSVSPATVKTHFGHIYQKLGVSNRTAAVAQVLRLGLVD
jgi:DNA-binding CsgD family transcriptional regulator